MQSVEQLWRIYSNRALCSFVLTALHKNPNYREFVIQFDTTDAGTNKLKDLCGRAVKYFQNTHESWGFNVTPAEHRGNKHDQEQIIQEATE